MRRGVHKLRLQAPEADCLPEKVEDVPNPYLLNRVLGLDRRKDPEFQGL